MFEPKRPRTYADLDYHEQERYKADFRATLFLLEGLPKDIYKHNEGLVIPGGESSVLNGAYVMHENSDYVPDDSFTTTLNIYKDQVAIYEQHAKFELTGHEQKMDDQMCLLAVIDNEFEVWTWSCELTSFWPAAAIVRILACLCRIPKNLLDRVSQLC
nr:hypothetical protein [Tanacetum cinerariifolium]